MLRPKDLVQFVGQGPPPTQEDFERHDPAGSPRPGDYGELLELRDERARVAWRFGAITDCPRSDLAKWHPRSKAHRFRILFESMFESEDTTYFVVTEGGSPKAVYMATSALLRDHPARRPLAVEVEDLGSTFKSEASDLLAYDEIA